MPKFGKFQLFGNIIYFLWVLFILWGKIPTEEQRLTILGCWIFSEIFMVLGACFVEDIKNS